MKYEMIFVQLRLLKMVPLRNHVGLTILWSEFDPENLRPISPRLDVLQKICNIP